jgi:hypothetical protein
MDETSIIRYITDTFEGTETVTANGDFYFFLDPEHKFPFATLVTNDMHDQVSNLARPSVFRLNIGVGKETFRSLFGSQRPSADVAAVVDSTYDYTAFDQLMPHPVYGRMYWVCVLNPSSEMFQTVIQPLLAEAYERDRSKHAKRVAHE